MVAKLGEESVVFEHQNISSESRALVDSGDLLSLLQKQKSESLSVTAAVVSCKAKVNAFANAENEFIVEEVQTNQSFTVKLAASCLQVPREGDVVHIQIFADSSAYIMAILELAPDTAKEVTLKLPENTLLQAKALAFDTEEFSLSSNKLAFQSRSFAVDSIVYQQSGMSIKIEAAQIHHQAKTVGVVAEKSTQHVMDSEKVVAGTDKVQAMNINYSAEALAKFSGNVTRLFGRELLKSDGKLMVVG